MLQNPQWEASDVQVQASKALMDAADLIERDGWCQGANVKVWKERFQHCPFGAITHFSATRPKVFLAVMAAMKRVIGGTTVPIWNDAEDRTAQQVIDKLREAATEALRP